MMRSMKKWLITGGAGFIGSNFVKQALSRTDHQLVVLDALTYAGNLMNLEACLDNPRLEFIKGSILNNNLLNHLFEKFQFDSVIHFAAESHVDRSILGPLPFIRTNIEGTFTLLEIARQQWPSFEGKRFIHISTDEVFGSLGKDDPAFSPQHPYLPSSPYSASKAASDHLARAWQHTFGLPVIITNCSNNFGPWQFPEKLIPLIILNAIEGKDLPIYGDGQQIRDWLFVEDHCNALLAVLEKGVVGETYTIGASNEKTNVQIVETICHRMDKELGRSHGSTASQIKHVTDRRGHDRRYAIDSTKIQHELGWKPEHPFEEALDTTIKWYLENKKWCEQIRTGDYLKYYNQQYGK